MKAVEWIEKAKRVIQMYEEGAIVASEVPVKIVSMYYENELEMIAEHEENFPELNVIRELPFGDD